MGKHVTFMRMQVNPGQKDALMALMADPAVEADMKGRGWEMDVTGASKDNPDELWGCVVWDTSERYYANADSPEQNAVYEKMRALLAADPDGTTATSSPKTAPDAGPGSCHGLIVGPEGLQNSGRRT